MIIFSAVLICFSNAVPPPLSVVYNPPDIDDPNSCKGVLPKPAYFSKCALLADLPSSMIGTQSQFTRTPAGCIDFCNQYYSLSDDSNQIFYGLLTADGLCRCYSVPESFNTIINPSVCDKACPRSPEYLCGNSAGNAGVLYELNPGYVLNPLYGGPESISNECDTGKVRWEYRCYTCGQLRGLLKKKVSCKAKLRNLVNEEC